MDGAVLLLLVGSGDGKLGEAVLVETCARNRFERLDDDLALGDQRAGPPDLLVDWLLIVLVGLMGAVEFGALSRSILTGNAASIFTSYSFIAPHHLIWQFSQKRTVQPSAFEAISGTLSSGIEAEQ